MRTVIINGSPRKNGDTAFILSKLKKLINGDIFEINSYSANITPCTDCRYCSKHKVCNIADDMGIIYDDNYDNIVIASPVYMSSLTPPISSIASRLQVYYAARHILCDPITLRKKRAVLILTAGGNGAPTHAIFAAEMIFKILNAEYNSLNYVFSLKTDTIAAKDDSTIPAALAAAAQWLENN